jgi:hypothetical protein
MAKNTEPNAIASASDGEIHEPALGVYVLTEFVYCPRAGLCAHETEHDEEEDSPPLSFFSFNPLYSLAEIEAALQQAISEMTWYVGGAAFSAVLAVLLSIWIDKLVGIAGVFGLLWFLTFAVQRGVLAFQLNQQRKQALAGKHREPNPNSSDVQAVHWWDLIQAGFQSQAAQDPLIDPELNFSGRPTRFLRRGNVVIPVWRMPHYDGRLHPQNFIRMAAYCHLVQKSLGAGVESPYGIILFGHGLDGVAIPFTLQRRMDLLEALRSAREAIEKTSKRTDPPPADPAVCSHCRYGKPRIQVPGETDNICNGISLPVFPAFTADNKCLHSLCGDRFRWLPPHEDVETKDLRSHG